MSLLEQASLLVTPNAVKAGKLCSIIPTDGAGDLNVVRATSAMMVNENDLIETVGNNIARLDYSNGSCPSILVEPQRTNLLVRSEEFENSSWTKNNSSIIPNVIISPSGLMNADKLVENNLLNIHEIYSFVGGTELRTNSIFAKVGERSRFVLWAGNSGMMFDLISLTTTPGNNSSGITSALIEDYGNGWYRCSITSVAGNNNGYKITLMDNLTNPVSPSPQYQGDGVSGLYIWGAQRENNSNATSYIPTVASTVTRNADAIFTTGISDLIGQTEGTIFLEFEKTRQSSEIKSLLILRGANILNDNISIQTPNNNQNIAATITANGVTFFMTGGSKFLLEGLNKIALIYSTNGSKFFLNGVLEATYTNTAIPTMIDFDLGNRISDRQWNAGIYQCSLWKTQLTDEQCIELTTL